MKLLLLHISTIIVLLTTTAVSGQNVQKADKLYDRMGYQLAIDNYGDSDDLTLAQQIRLAESHRLSGQSENAEVLYRTILRVNQEPIHYFHFAQALLMNNKVDEAIDNFKTYKSFLSQGDADQRADNYLNFIASKSFDRIKNIEIENTHSVNTDNFEFSPFITNEGILFVSSRSDKGTSTVASINYTDFGREHKGKDIWTKKDYNRIYQSIQDDEGNLNPATIFSESIEDLFHQGPLHMNADEDLLYFTSSHTLEGVATTNDQDIVPLEIYKSILVDGEWSPSIPFTEINTVAYNEAHPTLTENGQTIIFSSDREGGLGGMDLYISRRIDGKWSTPVNMGTSVNTPGNETFPTLHPSGQLYFSSDGFGGYGGLDIFHIDINKEGKLGKSPTNAGAPINSNKDDFGYSALDDDQSGYFSSSRASSIGRDDIFFFTRGKEKEEEPEEKEIAGVVDITPPVIIEIKKEKPVVIVPVAPKKTPAPTPVTPVIEKVEPVVFDNKSVIAGTSFSLDKVYYDFDKATLRDESIPELTKLSDFLNNFPQVTIELSSHTDSRGTSRYNKGLSQKRAESVVAYLINNNIDANRIVAKGYGEEQLRNTCVDNSDCTEEDHQYNRRTEFKILNLESNTNLTYTNNVPSVDYSAEKQSNKIVAEAAPTKASSVNYNNADISQVDNINARLNSGGSFLITVGAYSNPTKKIKKMKSLGFHKAQSAPIEGKTGISSVLLGSLSDLSSAKEVSAELKAMGISNAILKLD